MKSSFYTKGNHDNPKVNVVLFESCLSTEKAAFFWQDEQLTKVKLPKDFTELNLQLTKGFYKQDFELGNCSISNKSFEYDNNHKKDLRTLEYEDQEAQALLKQHKLHNFIRRNKVMRRMSAPADPTSVISDKAVHQIRTSIKDNNGKDLYTSTEPNFYIKCDSSNDRNKVRVALPEPSLPAENAAFFWEDKQPTKVKLPEDFAKLDLSSTKEFHSQNFDYNYSIAKKLFEYNKKECLRTLEYEDQEAQTLLKQHNLHFINFIRHNKVMRRMSAPADLIQMRPTTENNNGKEEELKESFQTSNSNDINDNEITEEVKAVSTTIKINENPKHHKTSKIHITLRVILGFAIASAIVAVIALGMTLAEKYASRLNSKTPNAFVKSFLPINISFGILTVILISIYLFHKIKRKEEKQKPFGENCCNRGKTMKKEDASVHDTDYPAQLPEYSNNNSTFELLYYKKRFEDEQCNEVCSAHIFIYSDLKYHPQTERNNVAFIETWQGLYKCTLPHDFTITKTPEDFKPNKYTNYIEKQAKHLQEKIVANFRNDVVREENSKIKSKFNVTKIQFQPQGKELLEEAGFKFTYNNTIIDTRVTDTEPRPIRANKEKNNSCVIL